MSPPQLLTVQEVAERLRVSVRHVLKLRASDQFPKPVRLGRSVRWRESDIARFIELGCSMQRFESEGVTP